MTFLSFDPNYALVAQGVILIGVLILGSVLESRRARR
jgi:ribose/xylose/arabinose/galactoside ABC-type transport system permease subunit